MPVSEEVIAIHLCKQTAAAFLGSVIGDATQECSYSTVLGYAGPFDPIYCDNVVIGVHELLHCSSGHKTAAASKLVGQLQQLHVPGLPEKALFEEVSNYYHCTTDALPSQREHRPADGTLHSWMTINILKDLGSILLKYKQNTFDLKLFHAFMQKMSPISLSLLLTPWLLQSL